MSMHPGMVGRLSFRSSEVEYPSAMPARGETSPVPFTPGNLASLASTNGTAGRLSGGCPSVSTGEKPAEETEHRLTDVRFNSSKASNITFIEGVVDVADNWWWSQLDPLVSAGRPVRRRNGEKTTPASPPCSKNRV